MEFSIKEIASLIDGEIEGDDTQTVSGFSTIEAAGEGEITFLHNLQYEEHLYNCRASAVIIAADFRPRKEVSSSLVRVKNPYSAMALLLATYQKMQSSQKAGIEAPSHIAKSSTIGKDHYIGAFSYVGENCKIGDRVKIYPHCYIGDDVVIGDDTIVFSGVKIYHGCQVGNGCNIHSGAVIGSDGFGFAPQEDGTYQTVPQVGIVKIGDHVDIGANTAIDRATMKSTVIGDGVKLDNLIQIGHNVEIGDHTVIASQTGIAGSTIVGKNCVIGGQVGVGGHIKIADRTSVGAQSGVLKDTKEGDKLFGTFAIDLKQFMRSFAIFKRLPDVDQRLRKAEKGLRNLAIEVNEY